VVEIIMVERMLDGVVKGEYSLGWALLPLFRVSGGTPGEAEAGRPLSVPLVSGTPRYLLFRNLYNEDLRPPKVIPNCSIMFQAEAYPAMDAYIPLLPQDFLVTYSDVVPGLRRFDTAGQLSITAKTVISTLAAPMLSPTYSIVLRRLQLALPAKLHELLLSLDTKRPQSFA
jgi:nephrocystin-4